MKKLIFLTLLLVLLPIRFGWGQTVNIGDKQIPLSSALFQVGKFSSGSYPRLHAPVNIQEDTKVYKPNEPRPTGYWVECDSSRNDTMICIDTRTGKRVSCWILEDSIGIQKYLQPRLIPGYSIECDTHWIYPIEYEAIVKTTTIVCDSALALIGDATGEPYFRMWYSDKFWDTAFIDSVKILRKPNKIEYQGCIKYDTIGWRRK